MFLVKTRDFYIKDGQIFQIDVSFNKDDSNYEKGYYLVISEVNLLSSNNKESIHRDDIKIQKKYSEAILQLLKETDEESTDILENCIEMKESAINAIVETSEIFIRKNMILSGECLANYSINSSIKNPKETLDIIESLAKQYGIEIKSKMSYLSDMVTSKNTTSENTTSENTTNKNDKKKIFSDSYFKPVDVSEFKFDNVAGLQEVKEELEIAVDYIKNPQKYREMGAELQKGILLYGPPGTGKTLLAKALAGETNSNFFQVSGSEFVEKYVGVGAKRVRELFETAKKETPSIIFIDEIDAIGSARNSEKEGEHNKTLNQLLVELDGFKKNEDVLVLAATNRLDTLDNALIRAGRLGEHLYVGNPDFQTRKELFSIHTANKPVDPAVDLEIFAKKTHGFNGADIKSICNNAALFAIKDKCSVINAKHFEQAFDKTIIGLRCKTKKMIDSEKKIVAYHEAGHALLNSLLSLDKVEKVSILPRGESLGLVYKLPNEDNYLYTKKQLRDKIKICLAGRVSEEVFFNEITNGASNDLEKASSIALKMVRSYGMDHTNNLLTVNENKVSKDSKDRASLILNDCYNECKKIIKDNKHIVEAIAVKLLEVEEINGDELDEIILGNTEQIEKKSFLKSI